MIIDKQTAGNAYIDLNSQTRERLEQMSRRGGGQRPGTKSQTAIRGINRLKKLLEILLACGQHHVGSAAIVIENRPVSPRRPESLFITRVQPLRMQVQLNVMPRESSILQLPVPCISHGFQFGMIALAAPESQLLHHIGENCGAGSG